MSAKVILSLVFVLLLAISHSIFVGTAGINSYFFPVLQQSQSHTIQTAFPVSTTTDEPPAPPVCTTETPLSVYMYDLPRRFHMGMIDRKGSDAVPETIKNFTLWPAHWRLLKQHSVEYWLMASLLYDGDSEDEERNVLRVFDPELAEVFFVPFFSSTSYDIYKGASSSLDGTKKDRQLQVDLLEFLRKSKYWRRSGGIDHVIPMQHPNAFRFHRRQVKASILLVADFGRLPKSIANLNKDIVTPYAHVVDSFTDDDTSDPFESRTTLLFFRGGTHRKDEGKIRAKLAKILTGLDDVRYEESTPSTKTIQESTQGMRSSKFCLKPAGDTPSSCRLFDAIVSHCVPVIVSDQIELPFEDELDYTKFSVFISVSKALQPGYMVNHLRQFPKEKWIEKWNQLKNVSHHFEFQYPPRKGDAVDMLWRRVKQKVPGVQLNLHKRRRLKAAEL